MRDTTTSEDRDDVNDDTGLDAPTEHATAEQATSKQTTAEETTAEETTAEQDATDEADPDATAGAEPEAATGDEPKRKLGRRARRAAAREREASASGDADGAGAKGDTVVLDKVTDASTTEGKAGSGKAGSTKAGSTKAGSTKAGSTKAAAAQAGSTKGKGKSAKAGKAKEAKGAASPADRARRLAQVITALIVLAVLLAVVLLVQLIKGPGDGSAIEKREDRREAARQQADIATARLFSFDYRKIDEDLNAQRAQTTGEFTREVENLTGPNLRPIAAKVQAVVQAVSLNSAVVEDGDGKGDVQVLVLLNQAVTTNLLPAPRLDRNRVVATMRQVNGEWKVAGIKAL